MAMCSMLWVRITVNRQRHIYLRATHYGRPMLVADGVTQLYRCVNNGLWLFAHQCPEVDNHNIAQPQPQNDHLAALLVVVEYIPIVQLCVPFQGHGVLLAATTTYYKTTLLRGPLVEVDVINVYLGAASAPLLIGNVAENLVVYLHNAEFS